MAPAASSSSSSSDSSEHEREPLTTGPTGTATGNQDLPNVLDALTTGKATFYNEVYQGEDLGRLILTAHRLTWYPDESTHDCAPIKMNWNKVTKYRVSTTGSDNEEKPKITIINKKQEDLPFVLHSKADLERLKKDLKQRIGGTKSSKQKSSNTNNNNNNKKMYGMQHTPAAQETQRSAGGPDTVMVVYKTKTGSDVSFTKLQQPNNDDDNNDNEKDTDNNDSPQRPPPLVSSSSTPDETVDFIRTMMTAREESLQAHYKNHNNNNAQNDDNNNAQSTSPPPSSNIVIVTLHKNHDTKLGMVLGHKENEQLCIATIKPNSMLRQTAPLLQEGMEVLSINNTDCRNLDSPTAGQLIKGAVGTLTIVARLPVQQQPPPQQQEED